jgi:hypothetical protein
VPPRDSRVRRGARERAVHLRSGGCRGVMPIRPRGQFSLPGRLSRAV